MRLADVGTNHVWFTSLGQPAGCDLIAEEGEPLELPAEWWELEGTVTDGKWEWDGRGQPLDLPPAGQPGLWCQWVPSEDSLAIVWDDGEKFYSYVEWLTYIVEHFLAPWGYKLNGEVDWQGEEFNDRGTIYVKDNEIDAVDDTITNDGPRWANAS